MSEPHSSVSRFALISVSDKSGVADFAGDLRSMGYSILSTGGTARTLREAGVEVTDVSDHTGFPEIMDGRVKTLHPRIHGGILGRDADSEVMQSHGIAPIELVVVNLYPFEAVTARADCTYAEAVENIDIGGPAMVRAAAKNHARVGIVTRPEDYTAVIEELREHGGLSEETRKRLAARAYSHTADYDAMIASWLERRQEPDSSTPARLRLSLERDSELRYGENPHQQAALYRLRGAGESVFRQLQGKALSYNNLADADAALECVLQFTDGPACIIVKHANPCGGAEADQLVETYERAYQADPVSAFGGIIAFNAPLDGVTAARIVERQFVEVIIAPAFHDGALEALASKPNVRVLQNNPVPATSRLDLKPIAGGVLAQQHDDLHAQPDQWRCVSRRQATDKQWSDLTFAWKMVRMVKSNAIVYAQDRRTLGIGAGQMSRVDSARIAAWKATEAGLSLEGSVMASDAFFPFRDSIDTAAGVGVKAIIQPGGSMRDEEVIAAADEHDMAMIFTGVRHFRH